MIPLSGEGGEARWIASDVVVKLGSVAAFRKLMGRKLDTWDMCYRSLWPQQMLGVSVLDHGGGLQSISTTFLMTMIYWGFTAPRTQLQRDASAWFLRNLVDKALDTRNCGFQLYLPRRGVAPVEVDRSGHFEVLSVVGMDSYSLITTAASQGLQLSSDYVDVRPHIATFVVAALTPGSHISDRCCGIALTFFRQLGDLINQAAPRMRQTDVEYPAAQAWNCVPEVPRVSRPSAAFTPLLRTCNPLDTTARGCSRQCVEPFLEEALADLTNLASVQELALALEGS